MNLFDFHNSEFDFRVKAYELEIERGRMPLYEEAIYEHIFFFYEEHFFYDKALELINIALVFYPMSVSFLTKKAEMLAILSKYKKAILYLDKALLLDQNHIDIYLVRASIFLSRKKYQLALDCLDLAFKRTDRENYDILFVEKANIFQEWEQYNQSVFYLKKALLYNPENEQASSQLMIVIHHDRLYEQGVLFYKKIIDISPYTYLSWLGLAKCYFYLGLYMKALETLDYALLVDDTDKELYLIYGEILEKNRQFDRAIAMYVEGLKKSNGQMMGAEFNVCLFCRLGKVYQCLNKHQKAIFYFTHSKSASHKQIHFEIGQSLEELDRMNQAIYHYTSALIFDEKSIEVLTTLAYAYFKIENWENCVDIYLKIVESNEQSLSFESWTYLIYALANLGQDNSSLLYVDKAIEKGQLDRAMGYILKAFVYYEVGYKKEAIRYIEMSFSLDNCFFDEFFSLNTDMVIDTDILNILDMYR